MHDADDPVTDGQGTPAPVARDRRWLPALVLAGVLLVALAVAAVALRGGEEPVTTVTEPPAGAASPGAPGTTAEEPVVLTAPARSSARCLVPTPASVARMEVALEGTVAEVSGDVVTLEVAQWYAGGDGATVELRNPRALTGLVGGVPSFEVGQRWLVAGSGGTVAVCGFTEPWSPAGAKLYEEAFGS